MYSRESRRSKHSISIFWNFADCRWLFSCFWRNFSNYFEKNCNKLRSLVDAFWSEDFKNGLKTALA